MWIVCSLFKNTGGRAHLCITILFTIACYWQLGAALYTDYRLQHRPLTPPTLALDHKLLAHVCNWKISREQPHKPCHVMSDERFPLRPRRTVALGQECLHHLRRDSDRAASVSRSTNRRVVLVRSPPLPLNGSRRGSTSTYGVHH